MGENRVEEALLPVEAGGGDLEVQVPEVPRLGLPLEGLLAVILELRQAGSEIRVRCLCPDWSGWGWRWRKEGRFWKGMLGWEGLGRFPGKGLGYPWCRSGVGKEMEKGREEVWWWRLYTEGKAGAG